MTDSTRNPYNTGFEHARAAHRLLAEGDVYSALARTRSCIEYFAKLLITIYKPTLDTTGFVLENYIDAMRDIDVFDEREISMLHRIRVICNRAAHPMPGEAPPTIESAQIALDLLDQILNSFQDELHTNDTDLGSTHNNRPRINPNYYDKRRPYYGSWAKCISRNELLSIPEYCDLELQANRGNIEAMLDIASGFLWARTNWYDNGLAGYTIFQTEHKNFNTDACYDFRYYFWISRAVAQALKMRQEGKWADVPLRYISTAFLEMIKFIFFSTIGTCDPYVVTYAKEYWSKRDGRIKYNVDRRPWNDVISDMFQDSLCALNISEIAECLLSLFNQYPGQIIAGLQPEQTAEQVKYIMYCWTYYEGSNDHDSKIEEWFAIASEDCDQQPSLELLLERIPDEVGKRYYQAVYEESKINSKLSRKASSLYDKATDLIESGNRKTNGKLKQTFDHIKEKIDTDGQWTLTVSYVITYVIAYASFHKIFIVLFTVLNFVFGFKLWRRARVLDRKFRFIVGGVNIIGFALLFVLLHWGGQELLDKISFLKGFQWFYFAGSVVPGVLGVMRGQSI